MIITRVTIIGIVTTTGKVLTKREYWKHIYTIIMNQTCIRTLIFSLLMAHSKNLIDRITSDKDNKYDTGDHFSSISASPYFDDTAFFQSYGHSDHF